MTDQKNDIIHRRQRCSGVILILFFLLSACSFLPADAQVYDIQLREAPYNYTYSLKPDSLYLVLKDRYAAAVQSKDNTAQAAAANLRQGEKTV